MSGIKRYFRDILCALLGHWMCKASAEGLDLEVLSLRPGRRWRQSCICGRYTCALDSPRWFGVVKRAARLQEADRRALAKFYEQILRP